MNRDKQQTTYNPNHLLNALTEHLHLTNDNALARHLKVARQVIEGIRSGRLPIGGTLLLMISQETGISVDTLRFLMGDRRARFRLTYGLRPAPIGNLP